MQANSRSASVVNEPNSDSESDDNTPSRRPVRVRFRRENDKTATELCSYAVVWWAALGIAVATGLGGGISRRVVSVSVKAVDAAVLIILSGQSALRRLGFRLQYNIHTGISTP